MSLGPVGASLDPEQAENFEDVSIWFHGPVLLTDMSDRWKSNLRSKVHPYHTITFTRPGGLAFCAQSHNTKTDLHFYIAVQHMATYWAILEKMRGSRLRLTKMDDEIYEHFKRDFPEFDPRETIIEDEMKSKKGKERWRTFMMAYEKKVEDYNFGTMLRANPKFEYGEKETIFG